MRIPKRVTKAAKYFLVEDHHEALKIWRKLKVSGLDLVHIDAHIDFGFHIAKPFKQAIEEARTLKDLKHSLELSLAFRRQEKDFDKQTNIGNYIYPAMLEGMVKDFYWIIPGKAKDFNESRKLLKETLRNLLKQDPCGDKNSSADFNYLNGRIISSLMGRRFVITTLEDLPLFKDKVLLDIDTDFLVVDKLKDAEATSLIGRRRPWIKPRDFVNALRAKIANPGVTTIAYSVNGGFTPMRYRHLGDEIAYYLSPESFKKRYKRAVEAARYFEGFLSSGKGNLYQKATKLNLAYKASDNNYGNLYLAKREFLKAEKEFKKAILVDPRNHCCFLGLGRIYLIRRDFKKAKGYFSYALRLKKNDFPAICGLAVAEFNLKNFNKAEKLFLKARHKQPFNGESDYFLGRIYEQNKYFKKAAKFYKSAVKLGLNSIDIIKRILKVSHELKEDSLKAVALKSFRILKINLQKELKIKFRKKQELRRLESFKNKIEVVDKFIKSDF